MEEYDASFLVLQFHFKNLVRKGSLTCDETLPCLPRKFTPSFRFRVFSLLNMVDHMLNGLRINDLSIIKIMPSEVY